MFASYHAVLLVGSARVSRSGFFTHMRFSDVFSFVLTVQTSQLLQVLLNPLTLIKPFTRSQGRRLVVDWSCHQICTTGRLTPRTKKIRRRRWPRDARPTKENLVDTLRKHTRCCLKWSF